MKWRGWGGEGERDVNERKINTKNAVCICAIHHKLSQLMCQNNRFIVPLSVVVFFFLFLVDFFHLLAHTEIHGVTNKLSMCVIF